MCIRDRWCIKPSECSASTVRVWSINHLSVVHQPSECGASTIWSTIWVCHLSVAHQPSPCGALDIIICKPIWFLTDGAPQPLQPDQPLTLLTEMLLPNFFGSDGCRIRLFASPFDLSHWRGSTIATDWHNNWGAPQYIDIRCVLHIIRAKRVSNWYISKKKSARVPVCRVFD